MEQTLQKKREKSWKFSVIQGAFVFPNKAPIRKDKLSDEKVD